MLFYLQREQELGYSFDHISSGYRCHIRNKQENLSTTNYMGKALDIHFAKGKSHITDPSVIQKIRDKIFVKYLGAKMGWSNINQMSMESAKEGAPRWVHVDVRQFEQKYKDHRFFVESSVAAHGECLVDLAMAEGGASLCSCVGAN
jgi:hypothetical protein